MGRWGGCPEPGGWESSIPQQRWQFCRHCHFYSPPHNRRAFFLSLWWQRAEVTPPCKMGSSPRGFACWNYGRWWHRFAQAATSLPWQLPVLYSRTALPLPVDLLPTFLKPTTCLHLPATPVFSKASSLRSSTVMLRICPQPSCPPVLWEGEHGATVTTALVTSGGAGGEKSSVDHQQAFLNKLTVWLTAVIISLWSLWAKMVSEAMVNGASTFISCWCEELACVTLRFRWAFCRGHSLSENPNTTGEKRVATCWEVILSQAEVSSVCWKHFNTLTLKERELLF